MGLFGSKYKTTVATTVSRVIEDQVLPDSVKTGVLSALLQDGQATDYIMEELAVSLGIKMNSYYKYGKDYYVNGVPSGEFLRANECKDDVEAVLSTLEGIPITTTYCTYGPPNASHIGWLKAIELYGLNTETNELTVLSTLKGFPVYMQDLQYVVPTAQIEEINPLSLEQWGISPNTGFTPKRTIGSLTAGSLGKYSAIIHDANASEDYFKLTYVWEDITVVDEITTKTKMEESITFNNNFYTDDANYFQARYIKNGLPKYFMYLDDSELYPTLDAFYTTANTAGGTFFPFAYFRFNKTAVDANKTTQDYITNKKLVKKLGVDYDELCSNINANPDIADVEQAMLIMAVPASTTNEYEQMYLFDFFKSVYNAVSTTTANTSPNFSSIAALLNEGKANSNNGAGRVPMSSMVIQDKKFKMTLNHAGIHKAMIVGSIGSPGTHTSEVQTSTIGQTFKDFAGNSLTNALGTTLHIYRKQLTENIFEEYRVVDLKVVYYIYGEYSVTADETDEILLIPIDRAITNTYSIIEREKIYSRSLHFVFNTRVVTKIKWYQTGVFKALLLIVAIIITIMTDGAGAELIALVTAGAYTAAVILVLKIIVVQLVMGYLFKLFVKVVGIKVAFILAIAAAIAGVYQAVDTGTITNIWAERLLMISTGLTSAGQVAIQDEMNDLIGEMSAYEKEMKKEMELLEEKILALDTSAHLSPFIVFGETPDEFYNRTIHAGNIGILGIDAVSNYVSMQLRLPDISTIKQFEGA